MRLFCKHVWKVLEKEVLPSAYEQMSNNNLKFIKNPDIELFRKKIVIIMACEKCSKTKTVVEES